MRLKLIYFYLFQSLRALELLNLPEGELCFLLDIGCGSGLSGEILDEEGHIWVGMDISPSMLRKCLNVLSIDDNIILTIPDINLRFVVLEVALDREVEGDLFLQDVGQGMNFRPGTFDGAIR